MARYFFHVADGEITIDDVGTELPDMDRVRSESVRTAGQMLSDGDQSWQGKAWRLVVADETGTIVFGINISVDRHGL